MANIDEIAYAIGADSKKEQTIKDWFGKVVSTEPFKVARLGSIVGVECVRLCPAATGDMVYVMKRPDGQHVAIGAVGGGLQIDLLWTNPNPTNAFAGQTVSVPWQDYKFVIIETYTDAYNSFPAHFESHVVPAQSGNRYSISVFREAPITRSVNFEDSGIRFGAQGWFSSYNTGDITWDDSYSFIVPTRIWGIKY